MVRTGGLKGSDTISDVFVRILGSYPWEILDGNGASVAIDLVNCGARHCVNGSLALFIDVRKAFKLLVKL